MPTIAQRSFAAGEIGPAIYPRVDTVKFMTGLRTCRNFFIKKHGGAANRPGTSFVCEVKDSADFGRLIPYRYTDDLTFIMELGEQYFRTSKNAVQTRETGQDITGVTNANPCVITYSGSDSFDNGEEVYISGLLGPLGKYLNERWFLVSNVDTFANTFELQYKDGTDVDSTSFGTYVSGGTVAPVSEPGGTSYADDELFDVYYAQNDNTIYLAHPDYPLAYFSRSPLITIWGSDGGSGFLYPEINFGPNGTGTAGAAGSNTYKYKITAVSDDFEESLANEKESVRVITTGTAANPVVFTTSTNHGFAVGDSVTFKGAIWASGSIADGTYTVSAVGSATTFSIAQNTTGFGAWVGIVGTADVWRSVITIHSAAAPTSSAPNTLSWSAISGAREYNIYKEKQGLYGFHGSTSNTSYRDEGGDGDPLENPPEVRGDINSSSTTYPAVVSTVQQRLGLANTSDKPQGVWMSRTDFELNFTVHFPIQDDDSIKFLLAGEQNEVRHILDLGNVVMLTRGGEWILQGDGNGFLTATQINPKQIGYNGASKIKPVVINNNALFIQARGNIVRDLASGITSETYNGNDLTIFSSHLFDGYTIVDWAYQQAPNSIVWAVRSDGVLLGMTYLKEQDIVAWHRHDFSGGFVESVACIPEGDEDYLYLLIRRTIDGSTKRYIERMNTRTLNDDTVVDSIFMDSAKTYDGRHTGSTTMTLSGGTTWAYDETITITASASTFTSYDVGKAVHLTGADGTVIRFTLTAYTSATVMSGRPHKTVPAGMRSTAIGNGSGSWALAIDTVQGLWHLEGEDVSVFADGFVVASPNNDSYTVLTVTNGEIVLDRPYAVIHVGLPITADLETLDIDTAQGETIADKKKLTNEFTVWLEKTRGLFSGPKPPSDDSTDPLENLYEMEMRTDEAADEPIALFTGTKSDLIKSEWNGNGRVFIRQVDPVPVSVLAIAPSGMIPFRGG